MGLLPYSAMLKAKKLNVNCFSTVSRLYFQGNNSVASEAPAGKSILTFDNLIVPVPAAKADIRWVLKVVGSNFSLRSCQDLNDFFRVMLLDRAIAKNL